MRIIYSGHARIRMKQRGLTELDVEFILTYPTYIRKSYESRKIAIGKVRNRLTKVVFIERENYIRIITIM